ncbi:MAG: hypothetical protein F6K40_24250 [Okeania sp. SIO3I5]|uniref:hypothetical protein n=1 Tax=Okeania sp. SIO3I5 TaxID=2607805 RepID=UPI0013B824D9|nr:hypothetical protein [Okeania sp. SIO3I5]NEQ39194.1 hypothetical protein [Okeania sp. SIO3I5]
MLKGAVNVLLWLLVESALGEKLWMLMNYCKGIQQEREILTVSTTSPTSTTSAGVAIASGEVGGVSW